MQEEIMQEEIWKDIKGYEGIYQVSSEGRVKSLERDIICKNGVKRHYKEQIRECFTTMKDEYPMINLWKAGHGTTMYVDYLVAEAFIPNPEGYSLVVHKNNIKTDNQVDNLEWIACDRTVGYYSDITGELIKTFSTATEATQYANDFMPHVSYLTLRSPQMWIYTEDKNK